MATIMITKDFDVEALNSVIEEEVTVAVDALGCSNEILNEDTVEEIKNEATKTITNTVENTIENADDGEEKIDVDDLTYAIKRAGAGVEGTSIADYFSDRVIERINDAITKTVCEAVNKFFNAE